MSRGICNVSVAAIRTEDVQSSEMLSQLLYGESFDILETEKESVRIRTHFDEVEGWVNLNQIAELPDSDFEIRNSQVLDRPYFEYSVEEGKILLSIGSEIPEAENRKPQNLRDSIVNTAKLFLNVPYLYRGRSFFGIDAAAMVQLVYKVNGLKLPRRADRQSECGKPYTFLEETQAGDLAFFENKEGEIHHAGIMLDAQTVIHVSGKVRMDILDSTGIFNKELNRHTHKLRFIKTVL